MKFQSIYSRNFMSIGQDGIELKLDSAPINVIVGKNGTGKSTFIIDSLAFCLFGKPFRDDLSITDLVNEETKKDLYLECKFENNGFQWIVKRGRKSDVEFEIWRNGELIKVPADLKVYQKYLEETVLGFDMNTFKQVIVLGSSAYVPFMKLKTDGRRKVVEDLLAIRIFSFMNDVAKEDAKTIRATLEAKKNALSLAEQSVRLNQQKVESLEQQSKTNVESNRLKINQNNNTIDVNQKVIDSKNEQVDELQKQIVDAGENKTKFQTVNTRIDEIEREKFTFVKSAKFYTQHSNCPECEQAIAEEFKQEKLNHFKGLHVKAVAESEQLTTEMRTIKTRLLEIKEIMLKISTLRQEIGELMNTNSSLQMTNRHLQTEIDRLSGNSEAALVDAKDAVKLASEKLTVCEYVVQETEGKLSLVNAAIGLLKDDKIKADVIRQYLPIINSHIQKNLEILEFPAIFKMDEKFKETITLNGKKRSYGALSEGQKLRVDLAILFAWRSVAAIKNSANSSLIVFDEIGSSALDSSGAELFQKLVNHHIKDSNIWMITHDSRYSSAYESVFEVSKPKGFTTVNKIKT